jgi:hypothetical protein
LLEARGWCVWWDRQIFIGEAFDKAIERELENAKGQYYRDVIADSAGPSRSDVSVNGYRADSRGRFDSRTLTVKRSLPLIPPKDHTPSD